MKIRHDDSVISFKTGFDPSVKRKRLFFYCGREEDLDYAFHYSVGLCRWVEALIKIKEQKNESLFKQKQDEEQFNFPASHQRVKAFWLFYEEKRKGYLSSKNWKRGALVPSLENRLICSTKRGKNMRIRRGERGNEWGVIMDDYNREKYRGFAIAVDPKRKLEAYVMDYINITMYMDVHERLEGLNEDR